MAKSQSAVGINRSLRNGLRKCCTGLFVVNIVENVPHQEYRGNKRSQSMQMTNTGANPINFAGRAANSPQFEVLYAEGMSLVEDTAAYLDGPGRAASQLLSPQAAALYSAESIRLTTRLMQLASWLLLQRSLNSGEMSREQVIQERTKLRLGGGGNEDGLSSWRELPRLPRSGRPRHTA
nr:DUF1465 family protein [Marinicella sp. W31]MDC2877956.1 DUF1465 family protein [Marinicella sp. W31]